MHIQRVGNGAPDFELPADASARLLPTLPAAEPQAPPTRKRGFFSPQHGPQLETAGGCLFWVSNRRFRDAHHIRRSRGLAFFPTIPRDWSRAGRVVMGNYL